MLQTFEVSNIRCNGCASTIKKSLHEKGFKDVEIDLSCEPRKITVDIEDEASLAQFRAVLKGLGYPFCDEEISFGNATTLKAKSFVSCAIGKFSINDDTK